MAAISTVDNGQVRGLTGQDGNLFQSFGQGVSIVWVARQGAHADDKAFVDGGGQADLGAELVSLAGLAF